MKKLLLLLLLSTSIHANPYMEAIHLHSKVYNYIEQTYKLAMATNDKSKSIVNTIWKTHEYYMDTGLETSLFLITQGLKQKETRAEVIEACIELTRTVKNRFRWMHHVMDTRVI